MVQLLLGNLQDGALRGRAKTASHARPTDAQCHGRFQVSLEVKESKMLVSGRMSPELALYLRLTCAHMLVSGRGW